MTSECLVFGFFNKDLCSSRSSRILGVLDGKTTENFRQKVEE
jgi:hypothetical protein